MYNLTACIVKSSPCDSCHWQSLRGGKGGERSSAWLIFTESRVQTSSFVSRFCCFPTTRWENKMSFMFTCCQQAFLGLLHRTHSQSLDLTSHYALWDMIDGCLWLVEVSWSLCLLCEAPTANAFFIGCESATAQHSYVIANLHGDELNCERKQWLLDEHKGSTRLISSALCCNH